MNFTYSDRQQDIQARSTAWLQASTPSPQSVSALFKELYAADSASAEGAHTRAVIVREIARVSHQAAFAIADISAGSAALLSRINRASLYRDLLAQGSLPALAYYEYTAGSAFHAMETTAVSKGTSFVLNGQKHFCIGAAHAAHFLVVAKDSSSAAGSDSANVALAVFLVPRNARGLTIADETERAGFELISIADLSFQDLTLSGEAKLGTLNATSLVHVDIEEGLAALVASLGILQQTYEHSLHYAKERNVGGRPLFKNQEVASKVVDMRVDLETADLLFERYLWALETENQPQVALAEAKVFATEAAIRAADACMQLTGTIGYTKNLGIEALARDARLLTIVGRSSEHLRMLIADAMLC